MSYEYVNNTGTVVPDTNTLYDEVATEWKTAFGQDLVTTPDTPQGVLITSEVAAREGVAVNNASLANQINPNLSGGVFLDAVCAFLGLERLGALPTVVQGVVFSGVEGTLIPQGSRARSTGGAIYFTLDPYVIGPSGTVTGAMQNEATGPVELPIGTLTTVVDTVLGWESVTNPIAGTIGQNEQSDASLRELRRITLARQTISATEAQVSGLNELDGVTSVAFRENVAATTQTIDGISMVAHSVWACVDGGTDLEIARSLFKNKTVGGNWNGGTTVPITDPWSGQIYNVKFQRPTIVPVFVQITVRVGTDTANPVVVVPEAIETWAAGDIPNEQGLKIGTGVSPFEIAAAVNYFYPQMTVTNVLLSRSGGTPAPGVLAISLLERGTINASYVTVVVVA